MIFCVNHFLTLLEECFVCVGYDNHDDDDDDDSQVCDARPSEHLVQGKGESR